MSDWKTAAEKSSKSQGHETLEETQLFGPRRRPIYPQLVIVDDYAKDDGEIIRLRRDTLTIGRSEGDLTFPAEAMMSGLHAKISLQDTGANQWTWVLEDQRSRYGIFLRLQEFDLRPGIEFLIGGTKVTVHGDMQMPIKSSDATNSQLPYIADASLIRNRNQIELSTYTVSQDTREIPLSGKRLELGRLAEGAGKIVGDPFIEAAHASLRRSDTGLWRISDRNSKNGLWLRVQRVTISESANFMLGEQRFSFRLMDTDR
jgi:pSer/pThr/pTyr-binding forkhead associated (FHA) protein